MVEIVKCDKYTHAHAQPPRNTCEPLGVISQLETTVQMLLEFGVHLMTQNQVRKMERKSHLQEFIKICIGTSKEISCLRLVQRVTVMAGKNLKTESGMRIIDSI